MKSIRQLFRIAPYSPDQVWQSVPKLPGGMDGGTLERNALANARRRSIMAALMPGPKRFDDMARSVVPAVLEYHLKILEHSGLVNRKNGSVELTDHGRHLFKRDVHDENGIKLSDLEMIDVAEVSQLLPCPGDLSRFRITAKITPPLEDGIRLLEPVFPRSRYSERMRAMIIQMQSTMVTMYSSGNVSMTMLKAEEEANAVLEELKSTVNYAISAGGKGGRPRADPMDINRHLAHTNCGECGEKSCYYFAIKLANGDATIDRCRPLQEPRYSSNRERLKVLMGS
jgi:ArsR family metal-binding transcriptional regulator